MLSSSVVDPVQGVPEGKLGTIDREPSWPSDFPLASAVSAVTATGLRPDKICSLLSLPLGGRMKHEEEAYRIIGTNAWVLNLIKDGFPWALFLGHASFTTTLTDFGGYCYPNIFFIWPLPKCTYRGCTGAVPTSAFRIRPSVRSSLAILELTEL